MRRLWLAPLFLAFGGVAGCGLVSDLDPPDPDASRRDGGPPDASMHDGGVRDAGAFDASTFDAWVPPDDASVPDAAPFDAGDGIYLPSNIADRSYWMRGGGTIATREDGCYCSFLNVDTGEIVGMVTGDRAPGPGLDPVSGIYFEVVAQASGPDLGVFVLDRLTIRSSLPFDGLYVYGDNALVLLVRGDVELDGHLGDGAGSDGYLGGAARSEGAGPGGGRPSTALTQGGGGGGFAGEGGDGGGAVAGGLASGNPRLVPLLHGSGGGGGYEGAGGRGGRAVQISSLTRIHGTAASRIDVRGSGGEGGGGGGGAGGAILLEAPLVDFSGHLVANGGAGGSCSTRGPLGPSDVLRAVGPVGCGGRGGDGGGVSSLGGGDALDGTEGAGGGGAAGRIRINATSAVLGGARTSPLASTTGLTTGPLP